MVKTARREQLFIYPSESARAQAKVYTDCVANIVALGTEEEQFSQDSFIATLHDHRSFHNGYTPVKQVLRTLLLLTSLAAAWVTNEHATARAADQSTIDPPTSAALRTFQTIDALDVERHWPSGVHVNWETGIPTGRLGGRTGKHTHCSAFVASAAEKLGIYILRPPEHSQTLLANAQFDWLADKGASQGWTVLADAVEAQNRANQGDLVVAVYRNSHDDKPGHIAIVRPDNKTVADVEREGPQITQAGLANYRSTTLSAGFSSHPGAWANHEIRFYAHAIAHGTKDQ